MEIVSDEAEPSLFAGYSLITGVSLSCSLITARLRQVPLWRLLSTDMRMPLPIIPILQSGLIYPGKQSLIKYFLLIPTPDAIRNDEVGTRGNQRSTYFSLYRC
jgi:enolase